MKSGLGYRMYIAGGGVIRVTCSLNGEEKLNRGLLIARMNSEPTTIHRSLFTSSPRPSNPFTYRLRRITIHFAGSSATADYTDDSDVPG